MNSNSTIYLNSDNVKIIRKALSKTKNEVLKTALSKMPDKQVNKCLRDTRSKIDYYLKCR